MAFAAALLPKILQPMTSEIKEEIVEVNIVLNWHKHGKAGFSFEHTTEVKMSLPKKSAEYLYYRMG